MRQSCSKVHFLHPLPARVAGVRCSAEACIAAMLLTSSFKPALLCQSWLRNSGVATRDAPGFSCACGVFGPCTTQHHVFVTLAHTTTVEALPERVQSNCASGGTVQCVLEESHWEILSQTCARGYQSWGLAVHGARAREPLAAGKVFDALVSTIAQTFLAGGLSAHCAQALNERLRRDSRHNMCVQPWHHITLSAVGPQ